VKFKKIVLAVLTIRQAQIESFWYNEHKIVPFVA